MLDAAIKIYRDNWATLMKVVIFIVTPVQVLLALVQISTVPDEAFGPNLFGQTVPDPSETWTALAGNVVTAVLGGLALLVVTAACFKAVSDAYLGARPGWRSSLGFAGRRFPSLLWLFLLQGLGLGLAFIALAIPAVWLGIAWSVAVPALLVEGVRGTKALRRSFRLVRRLWWRTFGVLLLGFLLVYFVTLEISLIPLIALASRAVRTPIAAVVISGVIGVLTALITTPFTAALITVQYYDLRVRKEGFDVELLARGIGEAPATPAPLLPPPPVPTYSGSQPPYWPPPPGWTPTADR